MALQPQVSQFAKCESFETRLAIGGRVLAATDAGDQVPGFYSGTIEVEYRVRTDRDPPLAAIAFANELRRPGFGAAGSDTQLEAGHLYLGADYLIAPAARLGWLTQFDWASETTGSLNGSAHGDGWMTGPYVALHLSPNVIFDGRFAWARSNNQVSPTGTYTDDFSTERTLWFGRMTGDYGRGAWRLSPEGEIVRFQDKQFSYINRNGVTIADHTANLGQVTFGPKIGYFMASGHGGGFEPFVAIKGVWTFERSANITPPGDYVAGSEPFTGKLEAEAQFLMPGGVSIEGLGALDNIGDSGATAYRGRASIGVPLN